MRILIEALMGSAVAGFCAARARRYAIADRLRSSGPTARRHVPAWLRGRMARALDGAALDVGVERALSTWLWGAAVAGVLGLGFAGPQVGVGLAGIALLGAPGIVLSMHDRRGRQIAAVVPETLERVASELRSGGTVATAISAVAIADGPLAADMARVESRVRLGASLAQALGAWAAERAVSGVDASAGALVMCSTVGGRSAEALDGLATSLRDRLGVAAEARALSSQARMSALVVAGAPVVYIAWSALVDPHALQVLTGTFIGRICLVLGLGLEALGGWWMRSIVRSGSGS